MTNICQTSSNDRAIATKTSNTANVTGDGTIYTAANYDSLVQGSGFVISTGIFTCTISGTFLFFIQPETTSLTASATTGVYKLVTTSRTYTFATLNVGGYRSQASVTMFGGYIIASMTAGDTATVTIQVSGTTKSIGFGNASGIQIMRIN